MTPDQSGRESNGNKRVPRISQSSSITEISKSDCFVSYPGHSLGESYPSAEMNSCILQPQPTGPKISRYFHEILVNMYYKVRLQLYFHFGVI